MPLESQDTAARFCTNGEGWFSLDSTRFAIQQPPSCCSPGVTAPGGTSRGGGSVSDSLDLHCLGSVGERSSSSGTSIMWLPSAPYGVGVT